VCNVEYSANGSTGSEESDAAQAAIRPDDAGDRVRGIFGDCDAGDWRGCQPAGAEAGPAAGCDEYYCAEREAASENASAQNQNSFVLRYGLKRADYDLLSRTIPTVLQAVPIREITKACRYLHREMNCRIVGCTPEYLDMNHLELAQGRFISDKDRREKTNVCVLAAQTAEELFQYQDPIGQSVKIADRRYAVVGVTSAREASAAIGGSMSGQEYNKDIYIPLETMRVRMGDLDIDRRQGSFSAEEVELNQITLTISDVDQVVPTAGVIRESLQGTHKSGR